MNDQVERETILEVLEFTPCLDAGFQRKKSQFNWTIASLGQKAMEDKRLSYVEGVQPRTWRSYRSLEMGTHFFKMASKTEMDGFSRTQISHITR